MLFKIFFLYLLYNNNRKMNNTFKIHGYLTDFYIRGKFIGSIKQDTPDREIFGYSGRVTENTPIDILLDNGKKIKKGTEVVTECQMICGKVVGTQQEKLETIKNSRLFYNK